MTCSTSHGSRAGEMRLSWSLYRSRDASARGEVADLAAATTAAVGVRQRPVELDLYVRADRQRLIQVLLNLALQRGQVQPPRRQRRDRCRRAPTALVRVEVADTGSGISEEAITSCSPRSSASTLPVAGSRAPGSGWRCARAGGGDGRHARSCQAEPGVGTTVSLELPRAASLRSRTERPARAAGLGVADELVRR